MASEVILHLLNRRRAVLLPNTVNCLGYTACSSGAEVENYLARPLMFCFNKQEKHIDQKEAVCTHAHKIKRLSRTAENREREYVITQGTSGSRVLAVLTRVLGKNESLNG